MKIHTRANWNESIIMLESQMSKMNGIECS